MSKPYQPVHPPYQREDVEILSREDLYQGYFRAEKLTLRHRLYEGGWSETMGRELFVRGPAVVVGLYDPVHDTIGLIEQFRVGALDDPAGPWCLEVVAGMIETDETPEAVARRELLEEAGVEADSVEYIGHYYPSPGACNEVTHVVCAFADLSEAVGVHGLDEEHEDIKVHVLPAQVVFDNLYGGRLNNAAALIALQWLQLNRPRLRQNPPG
ncbi:NUDIX domain-containing protein [Marinimicrobium alkaliphilum]|uniref:NUDIX domain-containing protein n=1 Tax=Marinimicrobium alkaliphilum TaxID=2202654 RepID=UPI000DB94053|nr:NUDIX domain-containing protein [Marinimicrobium alkaliphilum]